MLLRHSLEWFRPIRLADSRPGLITGLVSPYGAAPPNHAFSTCSVSTAQVLSQGSRYVESKNQGCQALFLPGTFSQKMRGNDKMTEISAKNDGNFYKKTENVKNFRLYQSTSDARQFLLRPLLSRGDICQKFYTTRFSSQKFYTLFLLTMKRRKCTNISNLSICFC